MNRNSNITSPQDSEPEVESQRSLLLQRLGQVNNAVPQGQGISDDTQIPLAEFHSRKIGRLLIHELSAQGIFCQSEYKRVKMRILVPFEERKRAFEYLEEFKALHSDEKPKRSGRDYDALFLLLILMIIPALVAGVMDVALGLAMFVTAICAGVSLEIVLQNYRYNGTLSLTVRNLFSLAFLAALLTAVWRWWAL